MAAREFFITGALCLCLIAGTGSLRAAEPAAQEPSERVKAILNDPADGGIRDALAHYLDAFRKDPPDWAKDLDWNLEKELRLILLQLPANEEDLSPEQRELFQEAGKALRGFTGQADPAEDAGWWSRWFDGEGRRGSLAEAAFYESVFPSDSGQSGGPSRRERYLSSSLERLVHAFVPDKLPSFHAWLFSGADREGAFADALRPPPATAEEAGWLPNNVLAAADEAVERVLRE